MRLIHETRSLQVYLDDLVFLGARLKSEPEVAELAGPIETLITEGRRRREEIEQSNQRVLVASARRVTEDARLDDLLMALGRAALDAAGGRRDGDPYRRLFARAPSELAGLSLGDELAEVRKIEAELTAVGGSLAEKAAPLGAQRARTEAVMAEQSQAEIALGRARTEARMFKQECNRARQRVEGALLQRLATRRRAATFFKPSNDGSGAGGADPEQPAVVATGPVAPTPTPTPTPTPSRA